MSGLEPALETDLDLALLGYVVVRRQGFILLNLSSICFRILLVVNLEVGHVGDSAEEYGEPSLDGRAVYVKHRGKGRGEAAR